MASTKKVIYSGREFVNLPGQDDTGYIQGEIKWEYNYGFDSYNDYDEDLENTKGSPGSIDYKLKFADCTRIIDFNINGETPEEQANAIHKVDSMIKVLSGFRKGLEEAFIAEEHIKNVREARKEARKAKEKEEEGKEKEIEIIPEKIIITKPRFV